jgi:hypothetical protein
VRDSLNYTENKEKTNCRALVWSWMDYNKWVVISKYASPISSGYLKYMSKRPSGVPKKKRWYCMVWRQWAVIVMKYVRCCLPLPKVESCRESLMPARLWECIIWNESMSSDITEVCAMLSASFTQKWELWESLSAQAVGEIHGMKAWADWTEVCASCLLLGTQREIVESS